MKYQFNPLLEGWKGTAIATGISYHYAPKGYRILKKVIKR